MATRRKYNGFLPAKKASAKDLSIGCVVWAKWRANVFWPAMTIRASDCHQKPRGMDCQWVFWFSDYQVSSVFVEDIFEFTSRYSDFIGHVNRKGHQKAVYEALEVLAQRSKFDYENFDDLTKWARSDFIGKNLKHNDLPHIVLKHLERNEDSSDDEAENCPTVPISEKIKIGLVDIEKMCIACRTEDAQVQHPIFKGGLCAVCKETFREIIFAIGEDGKNIYCIICGDLGKLILCDNDECQYSYCLSCILQFLGGKGKKKILETSPWLCFFCSKAEETFEKRENWEEELAFFFQLSATIEIDFPLENCNRPIRVLSLFDGISTGKLVLDKLGIEVEVYYASEIDEEALSVSKLQHQNSIEYVGDVTKLSFEKIESMCPIDLLIGGSPCNDLSLVNPTRKGLYDLSGSGCLFFNFFHVWKIVERLNNGHQLFFLYENVAAMKKADRQTISKFLSCVPSLIDAKFFSPQCRPRFFWGNIPSLYAHSRICYKEKNELQSCLLQELGRKANVKKIRTVTTKKGSLSDLPVDMRGTPDILWITELERVFGFPVHYTDVGNLSSNKRLELLGKSWSVPVITKILCPLQKVFKTRYDD